MDNPSPLPPEVKPIPPAKIKFDREERRLDKYDFPPATDVKEKGRVECLCCHAFLPFDRFQEVTDPFCYECRHTKAESELQELKARMCQKFTDQMIEAGEGRLPLEHVRDLLAEAYYDFGGLRVFVKAWTDQLKASFADRPGSASNLRACQAIASLHLQVSKLQHQEDLADLSDDQLRWEKEMALLEMLNTAAVDPHRRRLLVELMRVNGIQLSEIPGLSQPAEVASHVE